MVKGGYAYNGIFMSQNPYAEEMFQGLLAKLKPTKLLEIGTFQGGLTLYLREALDANGMNNTIIRTYDTQEQKFLIPIVDERTEIFTKNVFSQSYLEWKDEASKQEIKDFIDSGSPTLVLCDGGCKRCEYNLIAPLLNKGDVIMAHDYAPTPEYFEKHIKGKIWEWHEIMDSHIEKAVAECGLVPYHQEEAQKAVWSCKIKN